MNNKLKYLITAILITVFAITSAFSASAEESGENEDNITAIEATDVPEYANEDNGAEDVNFFGKVYDDLSAYAGEILCALTFVGSLTLALAYKKGLLPLIEKSLLTIGSAITKIKDNAKENEDKCTAINKSIDERLTGATEIIRNLSSKVEMLNDRLCESIEDESEARREKRQLRLVVDAQIDMLYDVFMSSALPQYQKDAIGEKIAKMKEALAENEHEG